MSASASVRVEKATSDLLIGPDWTMNIDICDSINVNHWEAKDVVKSVKKRLQHKNPKVQLLALTLLETMVKNCGDYVHWQIVERNILQEMTKIVKKKTDMHVRDKILVLLDSWQEAFGGPGGKHPQYYWAYEELRRSGVVFPQRSADAAPIFTPPVTHPSPRHSQIGYGMPTNSSTRLDEAMASEVENLSLSSLESAQNVMELLSDMLQTVNPSDRLAIKDELIVDLANQCRSNQKKLMQMLTSTGDEELLGKGLELNDSLQNLLAKHDAIASGSLLPSHVKDVNPNQNEGRESNSRSNSVASTPVSTVTKAEAEDEEDDFDQLVRRHSRAPAVHSHAATNGTVGSPPSNNVIDPSTSFSSPEAAPPSSSALALLDPPAPIRTTKEQDMIDLLSITLSTASTSPRATSASDQNMQQVPVSPATQNSPYSSQNHHGATGPTTYNSYVVPWATSPQTSQAQPQTPFQMQAQLQRHTSPQSQIQPQQQNQPNLQPQIHPQTFQQPRPQPQAQPQAQPQPQPQAPSLYNQYLSGYPPPPWAATPGYLTNQVSSSTATMFSTPQARAPASSMLIQAARPLKSHNSFPSRASDGLPINGDSQVNTSSWTPTAAAAAGGHKPFVPSYRLFEDLNVLGSVDGRPKVTSSSSSMNMLGSSGQGIIGGKK